MTEDWLPTAPRSCEHHQLMQEILSVHRAGLRPPSFRGGLHATLSPAIHQTGAVSCASRISNLLGASNTGVMTASGGRRHPYASSADARMAICRTSTGAVSFIRIFADVAKAVQPVLAESRCGRKTPVQAQTRETSGSPATVLHRCRWRSCFSMAVSVLARANAPGSASRPNGMQCIRGTALAHPERY